MVVYKSDIKRRYKDGSSTVESVPKRAKVHAQRKFAQGLSSTSLPEKTYVKEKGKVKPNGNSEVSSLLSADRPKTEDFLTFLCFRGTSALPSRLDFFNVASSSDNPGHGSNTSNQSSSVAKVKNEKISGKHSAVKIHPNKFKEKSGKAQTVASRMDVKRRSGRLARTKAIRRKQTIRRTQRSIVRRPLNSAVQRRIADKKMRVGLRSGGRLPAGSDVGLSTFRRPRSDRSSSSQTVTYPVRKSAIPLGDTSADDEEEEDEDEEDDDDEMEEEEEEQKKESTVEQKGSKDEKAVRARTRSSSLKSHPSPAHSLKRMPSRKTKEAATAYMEMLSKSLRSPDIETDSYDEEQDIHKNDKKAEKGKESSKRTTKPTMKIISKKPLRSLKDKSLKRAPLISVQRKPSARILKARRIEELISKRTRSRGGLDRYAKSGDQNKSNKMEFETEEEGSDEESEEEKEVVSKKKNSLKEDTRSKQNESLTTGRRSQRSLQDNVDESNKKKNTTNVGVKQTKTPKESHLENVQESKLSRRSATKVANSKKDIKKDSVKENDSKKSPNLRGRESSIKKDVKIEPEEVEPSDSNESLQSRRKRKELKAESNIKTNAESFKKEEKKDKSSPARVNIKKENEKESKPSPVRAQNQGKAFNKKNNNSEIMKDDSRSPAGGRIGNKKELKSEVLNNSDGKSSPARTTRQTLVSEKPFSDEGSIKNPPKRNVAADNYPNKKRGSFAKSKPSTAKGTDLSDNDELSIKTKIEEETSTKSKRNSRCLVAQNKDVKKKNSGKNQNLEENQRSSDGESKSKRTTRKKSEPIVDNNLCDSETELKEKKKRLNTKESLPESDVNLKPKRNTRKKVKPPVSVLKSDSEDEIKEKRTVRSKPDTLVASQGINDKDSKPKRIPRKKKETVVDYDKSGSEDDISEKKIVKKTLVIEPEESPCPSSGNSKAKRITRKKSELIVASFDKSESEEESKEKKKIKNPPSTLEESKIKSQAKKKVSTDDEGSAYSDKQSKNEKVDSTVTKPKLGIRKKVSAVNQSDEEIISKDAPKKKMKQSCENKQISEEDDKANLKVSAKKKSTPQDQNETEHKDKALTKKKANESTKIDSVNLESSMNTNKTDTVETANSETLSIVSNSTSKQIFSREGSIEKLDEKEMKGFDEINAKEMENKVDKFIEQMILKTSDDESKSKMRSRFKGAGINREEISKSRNGKPSIAISKESDQVKIDTLSTSTTVSSKIKIESNSKPITVDLNLHSIESSAPLSDVEEHVDRKKRNSKTEPKDTEGSSDKTIDESKDSPEIKDDKTKVIHINQSLESKEELSTKFNVGSSEKLKTEKCINGSPEQSEMLVVSKIIGDGNGIGSNRRASASSRLSTDTTLSECKVALETILPDCTKGKGDNNKQISPPDKKITETKKVTNTSKIRARGKVRPVKNTNTTKFETSDSEEECLKRELKVKAVKKKKQTVPEVKPQPRRGMRELKHLDTSQITPRASRARVAKHSSSSFYYETESSSQFSTSEEDIPVKKPIPVINKKEESTARPQLPITNDPPKETKGTVSNPSKVSDLKEEKKVTDIPEDLIDFKSDFVRSDTLFIDPSLKDSKHSARDEVLNSDGNIYKDIKANIPKIADVPSTSSAVTVCQQKEALPEIPKTITDIKNICESRSMFDEAKDSMELLASVAEDVSSKMSSKPVLVDEIKPATVPIAVKQELVKPKPKPSSIGETWIQAFKRAKIPKPGQISPISHSVKPFERKPFINQPFSKQQSPLKCDPPETNFRPFDRSSLKSQSLTNSSMQMNLTFKHSLGNSSTIPLVKPLTSDTPRDISLSKATILNIPTPAVSNAEAKREQTINNILNQQQGPKNLLPNVLQPSFKLVDKARQDAKAQCVVEPTKGPLPGRSVDIGRERETSGKHQNLPLAVEHALRKMSPVAVSRKPVTSSIIIKPQIQPPNQDNKDSHFFDKQSKSNRSSPSSGSKSSWLWKSEKYLTDSLSTKPSELDLMPKKKVNMTVEEIEKWLDDSTSTGIIEHRKDCELFEKNHCECSFRTGGNSMQNSVTLISEERTKVGRSVVEPPIQLKDIEPKCTAETISACKVEDYKEKLISKSSSCQLKENKGDGRKDPSGWNKQPTPTKPDKPWKSTKSMTEEEMCEFDFRFERNSNSPRESGSEMSSPTPKDEMSSSNDEGIGSHHSEKKSIFHKNSRPLSKSPCAFNAENESSVYAFEPELDLPVNRPFRRKNRLSTEESGRSTSIAVQVNLEPETVLECSTQTEQEEEFYIPLRRKSTEPQQIQGVTVKLDADPEQEHRGVTLRAKLVTKSSTDFPRPPSSSRCLVGRVQSKSGKPEQKVRPLSVSDSKPPVGTVQPTVRPPAADQPSTSQDSFPASTSSKSSQSTQFSTTPLKLPTDNKATSPLQSLSSPEIPASSRMSPERGFPRVGMEPRIVEAPAFYPTEKEFMDPLEYLVKITPQAERYGICRIVPPPSFKPECKVSDDMRFTSYNQYVHKMMRRWGPNVKEITAIKKYLATQSIALTHPPWIGGMEVDLPKLYQTVQQCGGLKEVIEKKRWTKVADAMKIPKSAQDRVTKLDDIYCKYLLPYDTLSHNERCKLLEQVEHDWEEKEKRILLGESSNNSDSESESDSDDGMIECITKGRNMALSQFYRIARNTLWMWFGSEGGPPEAEDVESEYWTQVTERNNHVCVHSGSIDCGTWGYGFPTAKTSSTSKHPWNLKVLTNHPASVLRSLPPLMGVTVPTLHVGMLFSTFCWYRDPHGLPWIEYLHTGANKIWYGVPDSWTNELRGAIKSVLPSIVRESPVWLPSDTAMLPPQLLLDKGVSLCRTVQEPGQFIVIFPKAYTSAICTGYLVSESVYYAPSSWLATAETLFKETKESCEPTMFSLEKLLFFIANDTRSSLEILIQACPMVESVRNREVKERKDLQKLGLDTTEKLPKPLKRTSNAQQQEYECNNCRSYLFLSHVNHSNEDVNYCLIDALDLLTKDPSQLKYCKLLYLYDEEEMEELIEKIKSRIDIKSQKKSGKSNSTAGNSSKT